MFIRLKPGFHGNVRLENELELGLVWEAVLNSLSKLGMEVDFRGLPNAKNVDGFMPFYDILRHFITEDQKE